MKKLLSRISCGILCAALCIPTLSSCSESDKINKLDEDERGFALWDKIYEQMTAQSCAMNMSGEMSFTVDGMAAIVELDGKLIEMNEESDDYASLTKMDMSMDITYKNKTITNTAKTVEGFMDGKMFTSTEEKSDGETSSYAFWSPISKADYLAHKASDDDMDFDFTIDENSCKKVECERNEEKKWNATYSGFSEDSLEQFGEILDGLDEMFEGKFEHTDVILSVAADEDFIVEGMELEFVFDWAETDEDETEGSLSDGEDVIPVFVVRVLVDELNTATVNSNDVDLSKYQEIEDLRIIDNISDAIDDVKDATSGKIHFSAKATYWGNTNENKATITLKETDGKYGFEIVESDSYSKTVYANGYISSDGHKEKMSVYEAKDYIEQYIDYGEFSIDKVASIKTVREGVYEITVKDPDFSEYADMFTGINKKKSTVKITITLDDGEYDKYVHETVIYPTATDEGVLTVTVTTTFTN